ncbi:uncharacterized protein SPSK_08176 [Sporothrix schenckii 1099-18]|uniref:Uncharacterized protein n=1 Tax=Sporothrix schenckii 1099-18 TaxID=1397361 RepID=A0A0F2MIT3_SPOSC|nr:uncharacterized protein SPSK_08176 [Sporothrix schenckii 1099-18]KJR88081.1 hypothetical protein SPSK_08176 [Sporothrix schenckii 1099-18]
MHVPHERNGTKPEPKLPLEIGQGKQGSTRPATSSGGDWRRRVQKRVTEDRETSQMQKEAQIVQCAEQWTKLAERTCKRTPYSTRNKSWKKEWIGEEKS